ncbi:MAG: hypothetical protein ACRDOK_21045 [Streptosporangiaceae bacterium]
MTAVCFACKAQPAGNDYAGPHSAWCPACQPRDERPVRAREHRCAACGETFGPLSLFDCHQAVEYGRLPPVACTQPDRLGMVRDARGTWQTPEGVVARARRAAAMAGRAREARSAA